MKKRWLIVIAVFLLLNLSIYIMLQTGILSQSLTLLVTPYIEKTFNRKVYMGKISLNFINKIVINDVIVSNPGTFEEGVFFKSHKIVLYCNLWHIFSRREKSSVNKIVFFSPHLFLSKKEDKWNLSRKSLSKKQTPPFLLLPKEVIFKEGKINLDIEDVMGKKRCFYLQDVSGKLNLYKKGIISGDVWLGRDADFLEKLRISGDINLDKKFFDLKVNVKSLDSNYCTKLIKWNEKVKLVGGKLNLDFFLKGFFPLKKDFLKGITFGGVADLKKGVVKITDYPFDLSHINGRLMFNNKEIEVSNLHINIGNSPVSLSGKIKNPLSLPAFDLNVFSSCFDFSLFPKIFPNRDYLKKINPHGKSKININIGGTTSNLIFTGKMRGEENRINNIKIEDLVMDFEYSENILNLTNLFFRIGEGEVFGNGTLDFNIPSSVTAITEQGFLLRAKNIDISLLKEALGLKKIIGMSNLSFQVKGPILFPQIKGRINLLDLHLGEERFKSFKVDFKYQNEKLEIVGETDDKHYKFRSHVEIKKDKLKINKFNIVMFDKGEIDILGNIYRQGIKKINLKVKARDIDCKKMPYFKQYFDKGKGLFNFTGEVKGDINTPILDGKLFSSNLMVNGAVLDFSTKIWMTKHILHISSFKLNGYSGFIRVRLDKERTGEAKLIAKDADVRILFDLFNLPFPDLDNQTKLKGMVAFNGSFKNLEKLKIKGEIELSPLVSFKKVSLDKLKIDFSIINRILTINNFYAEQKKGKASLSGTVGLNKQIDNETKFFTDFTNFQIGYVKLNGKIDYVGGVVYQPTLTMKGDMEAFNLRLNSKKYKLASSKVSYKHKVFHFTSFNLGKEYQGWFKFNFLKTPLVEGELFINVDKISSIFSLLPTKVESSSMPKGQIKGKVWISGILSNPNIKTNLRILDGQFRNIDFTFLSTILYYNGLLTIESAFGRFKEGGEIGILGSVYLKKKFENLEQLNLTFSLNRVNLRFLECFLKKDKKIKLKGITQGKVRLGGSFPAPLVSANIKMKLDHTNIGPFDIKEIETRFILTNKKITFSHFSAQEEEGKIQLLSGSFLDFSKLPLWQFQIAPVLKNINFAGISFFGGFQGKGDIRFSPVLEIKSEILTNNLWVNQYNFEKETVKVSFEKNRLKFLPVSKKNRYLLGEVNLDNKFMFVFDKVRLIRDGNEIFSLNGKIDLKEDKTDLLIKGLNEGVDVGSIMSLLNITAPQMSGKSKFNLRLRGNLKYPLFSCNMDIKEGSLGDFEFDNLRSSLYTKGKAIIINQLDIIKKERYFLSGSGEIPFIFTQAQRKEVKEQERKTQEINVNFSLIQGEGGLVALSSLSDKIKKAKGDIEGNLKISGTLSKPDVKGYLLIYDAEIYGKDIMRKVKNLKVDIQLIDNQIRIRKIYGKVGKGDINIWGRIYLKEFFGVERFDIYMETSKEKGIPIFLEDIPIPQSTVFDRLFPNLSSRGEVKLSAHLYGEPMAYYIDGVAELVDTHFTYPPLSIKKIWEARGYKKGKGWTFLNQAIWNFQINTGENVWYENEFVNVNIKGGLRLKGKTKEIKVSGKIEAIKGDLNYLKTTFSIKEANLEFQNGVGYLEGKAETRVQRVEPQSKEESKWVEDVVVMILEKGRLGQVKPKFVSKNYPHTSQEEAMRLAITGVDVGNMTPQDKEVFLKREVVRLVDATLASPLIKNVLRRTGLVDIVKVTRKEQVAEGTETPVNSDTEVSDILKGTTITLGKYLSDRFFLGYSMGLHEELQDRLSLRQEVEMSYRLKHRLYLKGLLGLGESEKKVFLEHQWRFGWEKEEKESKEKK